MTQFLIIGGVGLALVFVSVVFGDLFNFEFGDFGGDLFSTAGIGGFVGALGFVGAIVLQLTGVALWAWIVGAVAGVLFGLGVGWLARVMRRSESSDNVTGHGLIGLAGTVISAIPEGGYGEVRVTSGGHLLKLNAKSATAIPQGARVWVSAVLSATGVEVTPVDELPASADPTRPSIQS